ncbi:MAG: HAD hydrolase family protein [Atopobiaceae bacterium]|nr:HAD hydrolase family protein [Atopobiaceae bacterium]
MIGPTKLCPKGIGLVLLDLDDTVIIDGTKVTPRVMDAINLARERGCMVCVASGRDVHMVPGRMGSPECIDYMVCANGARIFDTFGKTLHETLMTKEQVLEAMDALEPLGAGWNAFIDGHSYFEWRGLSYMLVGRRMPLTQTDARKSLHTGLGVSALGLGRTLRKVLRFGRRIVANDEGMSQVFRVRPYVEEAEEGIAKVGCSLPSDEACLRAIETLKHLGNFEVARMSKTELEITAKGVTKGTGALWLMDYLGISPQCAVAFGDSENDASLAKVCGIFVAVDNGDDRIKDIADDICESVYDDGVARWLERAMAEADASKHGADSTCDENADLTCDEDADLASDDAADNAPAGGDSPSDTEE